MEMSMVVEKTRVYAETYIESYQVEHGMDLRDQLALLP